MVQGEWVSDADAKGRACGVGIGEPGTEDWRVYVDNMLVLYEGEDVVEFAHQVKRLVEKLTAMGMKLKPAKCKVGYTKMRILGHLCEKGSAQIDPEKVKCFSEMERPKSLQALRSLLGFLNYVRDYMPLISDLLGPFQELAKRRKWDDSLWGGRWMIYSRECSECWRVHQC